MYNGCNVYFSIIGYHWIYIYICIIPQYFYPWIHIYYLLSAIYYLLIIYYLLTMWDMYIYICDILKPTSCPVPARRFSHAPTLHAQVGPVRPPTVKNVQLKVAEAAKRKSETSLSQWIG